MASKRFPGIEQCLARVAALNTSLTSLTIPQCEQQCGVGQASYEPEVIINAVATWMLPLFLLVGNVEYSNFDLGAWQWKSEEFICVGICDIVLSHVFVLCRLLGNPMAYICSHLQKLEDMRQSRSKTKSKDHVAIVCIALHDFPDTIDLRRRIVEDRSASVDEACKRSALALVNSRTGSTRRSALAIIFYAATLFISLILAMNQDDMPLHSPHTIALRMLCYWLITAAVLSSATGAFPTEYTAWNDLRPVFEALPDASANITVITDLQHGSYGHLPNRADSAYFWSQAIVAFVAVFVACTCSFTMSWLTPAQGLGCRNFVELGFFFGWLINFGFSIVAAHVERTWAFWLSIAIDVLFAISTVLGQFLGWSGWYNSCKCWGAWWTLPGGREHHIPLDLAGEEIKLAGTYYGIISSALIIQCLLSFGVLFRYRSELQLIYGKSDGLRQLLPKRQ